MVRKLIPTWLDPIYTTAPNRPKRIRLRLSLGCLKHMLAQELLPIFVVLMILTICIGTAYST